MTRLMVEVFKTSIFSEADAYKVMQLFRTQFPDWKCNFDLDDCDKIFRVESDSDIADKVVSLFHEMSFSCDRLE